MVIFKQKKVFSIKKVFYKYFISLFVCTSGVLIFYCIMFIRSSYRQMSNNANSAMRFYVNTLQTEMSDVSSFIQKLCYADNSFQLLTLKDLKDFDKVAIQYNITEMLKRHVAPYECIFVFNEENRVSMFAAGSSVSLNNGSHYIYLLKESMRNYWFKQDMSQLNTWLVYHDENHSVLMKTLKLKDIYVCATLDLNNFNLVNDSGSDASFFSYGFFNREKILTNEEFFEEMGITVNDLNSKIRTSLFSKYVIRTMPVENTDISLCCVFSSGYMWSFTQILVLIFILLTIITCAIIIYIFYSLNNILLYPINRINDTTKLLEQNNPESFLANKDTNIIEYNNINNALAHLIEQKITLNNEKQREAFEKDHARLQYYYAQTRSHFFVNCLKSLYNMLELGEYEKMRRIIISLSNHLRYVFHDNLKLVTLESELREVNDYCNIIMLDQKNPIIIDQQVDEQLHRYMVPSLLIQTFLENTAKYNRHNSKLIIFSIKISKTEIDGVPVMQIHLSDNGVGYPPDILEKLNSSENDLFAKKHVGISNLKHRIGLIYRANYRFAFYNSPSGGACALIYLPLLEETENLQ